MSAFLSPPSLEAALDILAKTETTTQIVAGGTIVALSLSRRTIEAPEQILYIGNIRELGEIRETPDVLTIGSLVTLAEVAQSDIVCTHATALSQAAEEIASPQVRNRATVGGNLAAGGDLTVPLMALDCRLVLRSRDRTRRVAVGTAVNSDELLAAIEIPKAGTASQYLRLGRRRSIAPPIVAVAVGFRIVGGNCTDARIVAGGGNLRAIRLHACETSLASADGSSESFEAAAAVAADEFPASSDLHAPAWYRQATVPILVRRALGAAWERVSA